MKRSAASPSRRQGPRRAFCAVALAAYTGIIFGLGPAVRGSRPDPATVLKAAPQRTFGRGGDRLRSSLVVAQTALALILLVGAQLAFYFQNPAYLRIGRREPRLSNAMRERLALNTMLLVGVAFRDSARRYCSTVVAPAESRNADTE